jgi:hypothetical protein
LAAKLFKIVVTGKFLGLQIDNTDYSVQQALPCRQSSMTTDTFKLLYCTYWHFPSIPLCLAEYASGEQFPTSKKIR